MPLGWLGCGCCGGTVLCHCSSGCDIPPTDLTFSWANLGSFFCSGPPLFTTVWLCGPQDGSTTLIFNTIFPCTQWAGTAVVTGGTGTCSFDIVLSCLVGSHPPTLSVSLLGTPVFTGDSTNADIFTCGESIMMSWTVGGEPADFCGPGQPAILPVTYTISL